MANRAGVESYILKYIDALLPGSGNVEIYRRLFKGMSNPEFEGYMQDLESGKRFLTITAPNLSGPQLNIDRNLAIARELGHDFFERIWIGAQGDVPEHLTPIKYMVIDLPLRRASQMLIKKISIPDDNHTVDAMTGQPTGASKGARISYPELQVCAAMGLESTMVELVKYRGGDQKGGVAMNTMISKYGSANIKTLSQYASGVESTKTLKTFLTAMHLRNTL
jgi:hypothetical protein